MMREQTAEVSVVESAAHDPLHCGTLPPSPHISTASISPPDITELSLASISHYHHFFT